eukprot:gene5949-6639_t
MEEDSSFRSSSISEESQESYIPLRVLGKGAFGQAVLYKRDDDKCLVVWKEIDLPKVSEEEKDSTFNEVEILSLLDHINIIAYYNHFFDDVTLYIEMEYANGGTLFEKIRDQKSPIPEDECLWYFYQLISAVSYIHENGILHRDIKTLNILLTKSSILKLGDFGISKVLESNSMLAETHVGTPYYMSPELVRGEKYDNKSDIWACGCVLYELLSLKRVFDSTNQLGLICSILENDFEKVDDMYSKEVQAMLGRLLDKDMLKRPTASEILEVDILKEVGVKFNKLINDDSFYGGSARRPLRAATPSVVPVVSSLSSDVYWWGGGKIIPQKLESFSSENAGMDVAAGHSHFAIVTVEREVYTWANIQGGTSIVGQLGHGDFAMYRSPKKVDFFTGTSVKQVACGEDFTAILTESGVLYMTGSDYWGCIGCGQSGDEDIATPMKVEKFTDMDVKIVQVACGDSHVVALTEAGTVFTWGCGEHGRLGLGSEEDFSTPQQVTISTRWSSIAGIECGRDNTFLLTSSSNLLAFGNNEYNKLGFNQTVQLQKGKSHSSKTEIKVVHCRNVPSYVHALKSYKIKSISAGKDHSAVVGAYGRVVTFGDNKCGQLGTGDYKKRISPYVVQGNLVGKVVKRVGCGDGFTVVATSDNHVFSWGLGENGRLGISSELLSGKTYSAVPKPIFGSLHKVASLKCRHWHTIMLCERTHGSRVIQKSGSIPDSMLSSMDSERSFKLKSLSAFATDQDSFNEAGMEADVAGNSVFDDLTRGNTGTSNNGSFMESSMNATTPSWLRQEFNEAEIIPFGSRADGNSVENQTNPNAPAWSSLDEQPLEGVPREHERMDREHSEAWIELEEAGKSPDTPMVSSEMKENVDFKYKLRIKKLESENLLLRKRIEEQDAVIRSLSKQNKIYAESSKKLLSLSGEFN